MENNTKFLEEFKKLETVLRKIANKGDRTSFRDILDIVENKNYVIQHKRQIIQNLYALRNIFSHIDRDKYIANVNDIAFNEIKIILKLLNTPPKAGDVFKKSVFTAQFNDRTEDVIKEMNKNIYTHVPIYNNKEYLGTFSENTIFAWLADHIIQGQADFRKLELRNVDKKYLDLKNDTVEFISEKTNIFEIKQKFEEAIKKNQRLGALFITHTGGKNHFPPIGIVTAYDLPKIDEYLK